jgi:hypothetical protein
MDVAAIMIINDAILIWKQQNLDRGNLLILEATMVNI